jgi:hypothetical protein
MPKSQLVSAQIVFNTLLDNLLLQLTMSFSYSCNIAQAHTYIDALSSAITTVFDIGLPKPLQQFKAQLPNLEDRAAYELWWSEFEYQNWIEQLKRAVSLYRNAQSYWHCDHKEILNRYYNANKLLIDCLEHNYELTIELRQEIETALLLSEKELQKKQSQKIKVST